VEIPSTGIAERFDMDTATQERFIQGLDDIGITMSKADAISAFESTRPSWLASR
jgi:3-isopropylmalate/(R)-2-methylmalate dehydratase small subunit